MPDLITVKRHTLTNAIRAAADMYESDAQDQHARIAECFEQQAKEARAHAEAIDEAVTIRLED